jgi:hypothetical protein
VNAAAGFEYSTRSNRGVNMNMNKKAALGILCFLAMAGTAFAQTSASYDLTWNVVGGGGGPAGSSSYAMRSTAGQPLTGTAAMNYMIGSGYWYGIEFLAVSFNNTISIPDVSASQASEQRVPITIYNSTGVASVQLKLSYNASVVLAYSDPVLDKGDFTDFYAPDNSHNTSGYIRISTYKLAPGGAGSLALTGNPVVGYVRLRAVGNAGDSSSLKFSDIVITDDNSTELPYALRNGKFVIVSDNLPPKVTNAAANQSDIPDDTDNIPLWGETARLNVTVTDESGVASVTVNLSEIGGSAAKPMINIGGNIYSTTTNASAGTPPKVFNLTVNAKDTFGNSNTGVKIRLKVMKNGDVTGNGAVNIGDALRLANNVSHPGAYALSSIYVAEVTGDGKINIGDALRLANNVSYPGAYILK